MLAAAGILAVPLLVTVIYKLFNLVTGDKETFFSTMKLLGQGFGFSFGIFFFTIIFSLPLGLLVAAGRRIGMILIMPLPQMLQITMIRIATIATSQFVEQLLIAVPERQRPIAMMIGPVTIGGKNFITRLTPKILIRPARMRYTRPAKATPKHA